ncbi:MAG: DUF5906 domain-containing protein [Bacteroidia bacterium]|nr:DUF5906 domain-containing protein [Bacteroidia bacterium]
MNDYLNTRLAQLGLSKDFPGFTQKIWRDQGLQSLPLLYPDDHGNICIPYLSLNGEMDVYDKTDNPGNVMQVSYIVKRLRAPEDPKRKYENPKGRPNRIYLTPTVIDAYRQKQEIPTLYVVEGQFKALAGWRHGLHIVGITGIWGWKKGSKKPELQSQLKQLLEVCKPQRLVLLLDADSRLVKPEYVLEKRDLAERLENFFRAVQQFSVVMESYPCEAYFAQIHEDSEEKGLDDLLHASPDTEGILKALHPQKLQEKNPYIQGLNLSLSQPKQLKAFFRLNSVSLFYNRYEELIGEEEFIWKRGRYRFSEETGKVEQLAHPDSFKFLRVGCDYYKKITLVTQSGDLVPVMEPWKKGAISEDYPKEFVAQIPKFDTFVNIPDHSEDFKQVYALPDGSRLYNMYAPLPTKQVYGRFPTIYAFIKHVFGESRLESGLPRYQLALDWMSLLFQKPRVKLPIICLVSEENETGKSTFVNLLMWLFGENVVRLGNSDLTGEFNAHYISKLVACIEEGLIEKQDTKEKLKSLSTADRDLLNAKFSTKTQIDVMLKFVITSNHPTKFIPLEESDNRFFVCQVPQFKHKDPKAKERMKKEVPAFLYYLANRRVRHPEEGRMWFRESLYKTPEFMRACQDSLPVLQRSIRDYVVEYFWRYATRECNLTLKELLKAMDLKGTDRAYLKKILTEKMGIEAPTRNQRKPVYEWDVLTNEIREQSKVGQWYTFRAEDYLTSTELEKLAKNNPRLA